MHDTKIRSYPATKQTCMVPDGVQHRCRYMDLFAVQPDFPLIGFHSHYTHLVADFLPRPGYVPGR